MGGGDPDVLTCGEKEGADGWRLYTSDDCLTENNAEVFPTVLSGVWNLFKAAGNTDRKVYSEGQKMFYKYLKEQADELSDATALNDCVALEAPEALEESDA